MHIPTAKEFLKKFTTKSECQLEQAMIEFAAMHVTLATMRIQSKANVSVRDMSDKNSVAESVGHLELDGKMIMVDGYSILSAYPITNVT